MATSSSNHVDNLAEGNHKCYCGHGKKVVKNTESNTQIASVIGNM